MYQGVAVRDRGPQLRAEALGVESGQAGRQEHVVRYEVRNDAAQRTVVDWVTRVLRPS